MGLLKRLADQFGLCRSNQEIFRFGPKDDQFEFQSEKLFFCNENHLGTVECSIQPLELGGVRAPEDVTHLIVNHIAARVDLVGLKIARLMAIDLSRSAKKKFKNLTHLEFDLVRQGSTQDAKKLAEARGRMLASIGATNITLKDPKTQKWRVQGRLDQNQFYSQKNSLKKARATLLKEAPNVAAPTDVFNRWTIEWAKNRKSEKSSRPPPTNQND